MARTYIQKRCQFRSASRRLEIVVKKLINAENLALITVMQLLNPGNKVLYHTVVQLADCQTLEARIAGPEKMLDTMAAAEMGRYYGLPVGLPILLLPASQKSGKI